MNARPRAGLAIFVKTPGHSPLKTRLAATLGAQTACRFHLLSAQAVAAVAQEASNALPGFLAHWAVAEDAALDDPYWRSLPRIAQGPGDLGARMGRVHDHLRRDHPHALLLGADTPQVCVDDLRNALLALEYNDFVLGPSVDGGFWLFGSRTEVPAGAWTTPAWSRVDTASRFAAALQPVFGNGQEEESKGPPARLRTLRDVDVADDMPPLLAALEALPQPLEEQSRLADWLRIVVSGL